MACEISDTDIKKILKVGVSTKKTYAETLLTKDPIIDLTVNKDIDLSGAIENTNEHLKTLIKKERTDLIPFETKPFTIPEVIETKKPKRKTIENCILEKSTCLTFVSKPTIINQDELIRLKIAFNRHKIDFLNAQHALLRRNNILLIKKTIDLDIQHAPHKELGKKIAKKLVEIKTEEKELDERVAKYLKTASAELVESLFFKEVLEDEY
jgi:hypothetical protein